mgnify:CR=1 FL=1
MKTVAKTSGISIVNNRKIKVFVFFLVLTSIMWLLIELSKTYTKSAIFKLEYKNLPADKLMQIKPLAKVDVAVKSPGFKMLKFKFKQQKLTLDLASLSRKRETYFILPNEQLTSLNSQLPGETELLRILKDTIFIEIGNNISKKVPIVPKIEILFKLGYNFIENLNVVPDSVTISGPDKYIDSIKEISTTLLKLSDVYETVDEDLSLVLPKTIKNIKLSFDKVKIKGEVDKFTEGRFVVPVTFINEPDNLKINSFPKQIEVTYQVGVSNFNKINENSFLIVFDYNQYQKDTTTQYLTPIIKQKSELISSLKINPSRIEFLIQK